MADDGEEDRLVVEAVEVVEDVADAVVDESRLVVVVLDVEADVVPATNW